MTTIFDGPLRVLSETDGNLLESYVADRFEVSVDPEPMDLGEFIFQREMTFEVTLKPVRYGIGRRREFDRLFGVSLVQRHRQRRKSPRRVRP